MRRSEWLLSAYFVYTAVLALALPVRPPIPTVTALLNLTILAGFALLAYADSLRHGQFLGIVRDWYPLALMPLCVPRDGLVRRGRTIPSAWKISSSAGTASCCATGECTARSRSSVPSCRAFSRSRTFWSIRWRRSPSRCSMSTVAAKARGSLPVPIHTGRAALLRTISALAL